MSWQEAKNKAEAVYAELRKDHDHGYVGMVISALKRLHVCDKPKASSADRPRVKPSGER